MPGESRTVQTRKSSDTSGSAAAVRGRILTGRASGSYAYGASKMCGVTVRE